MVFGSPDFPIAQVVNITMYMGMLISARFGSHIALILKWTVGWAASATTLAFAT